MPILTNARHERFAQALAAGKNATEAYISAGYEAKGNSAEAAASRLLRDVRVSARVVELQSRVAEGIVLTKQWVIERLVENANRAMQAEQAVDADGRPSGGYKYEGSVANRALELLGKELGMFIDRKEIRTGQILTDDELDARINDLAGTLGVEAGTGGAAGGETPPGRTH